MTNSVRIVVVDDHNLVRSGFRLLLEQIDSFEVVGEASSAENALELIATASPQIVVTDIAMGGMTGIELTRELQQRSPEIKCIVLSMHKSSPYVKSAMSAGASGYLLKESVDAELEIAIRSVLRGDTYLSPAVAKIMITPPGGENEKPALTRRQTEVLQRIAEGQTTKEIGLDLGVSPKTVETHRAELMRRLNIFDVAGLVRFAIREGYIELD